MLGHRRLTAIPPTSRSGIAASAALLRRRTASATESASVVRSGLSACGEGIADQPLGRGDPQQDPEEFSLSVVTARIEPHGLSQPVPTGTFFGPPELSYWIRNSASSIGAASMPVL